MFCELRATALRRSVLTPADGDPLFRPRPMRVFQRAREKHAGPIVAYGRGKRFTSCVPPFLSFSRHCSVLPAPRASSRPNRRGTATARPAVDTRPAHRLEEEAAAAVPPSPPTQPTSGSRRRSLPGRRCRERRKQRRGLRRIGGRSDAGAYGEGGGYGWGGVGWWGERLGAAPALRQSGQPVPQPERRGAS